VESGQFQFQFSYKFSFKFSYKFRDICDHRLHLRELGPAATELKPHWPPAAASALKLKLKLNWN
jgi:hypothetical protein